MSSTRAMGFNEVLINLVKDRPCLYDAKSKDFKDRKMKERAWQEIADKVKQPTKVCSTRWTTLRDKFTKVKKKLDIQNRNDSSSFEFSSWEHYESLSFLKDHIKHRCTTLNYGEEEPTDIDPSNSKIDVLIDDDASLNGLDLNNSPTLDFCKPFGISDSAAPSKKRKLTKSETENFVHPLLSNPLFPRNEEIQPMNQYQAFGHLVAARLQAVPPENAELMMASISSCLFGDFA